MKNKIYLIPGALCDFNLWDNVHSFLANNVELIHLAIPDKPNIDEMLEILRKQLPQDNISLAGFSLGGYLAAALALSDKAHIKRLLVISDSLQSPTPSEVTNRNKAISSIEKHGFSGINTELIKSMLHRINVDNDIILNKIQLMADNFSATEVTNQLKASLIRQDLLQNFSDYGLPTLFTYGDEDVMVNKDQITRIENKNHTTHYQEISHSGHFLPLEQPEKLAGVITNWMTL